MNAKKFKEKMIEEEKKHSDYWSQFSKRCPKCHCSNYLKPDLDFIYCKICSTIIFRDKKAEFKYNLKKEIEKEKIKWKIKK